jgi:uncharacterized protein (TIRG00374 family)
MSTGHSAWWWSFRAVLLLATGISLYLLAPGLIEIFSSWDQLKDLRPEWVAVALVFEAMSYISLWEVWRIGLRASSWFAVGTSQLVGGAMGSLVPGGGATASAFSYRLLIQSGVDARTIPAGMTASFIATTSAIFAFPVLAVPAIIGGVAAPHGLLQTAYLGVIAFALVGGAGTAALFWNAPLRAVGRAVHWTVKRTRFGPKTADLPDRLLYQRDAVREAFGSRWLFGVTAAVGKAGFDYLALVCCLAAVNSHPNPSLVLLAYAGGALLGFIPLTPGGLGFVETGLTGLLVLAGVGGQASVVATLAYRLISFWLPLPCAGVAFLLHRRRYGRVASASTVSPP